MKTALTISAALAAACFMVLAVQGSAPAAGAYGESEFKEHCAMCHPDGGNIINPKKTLHKKDRVANGIKTQADIIKTMRNPGQGMTTFDEKTIPEKEAKEIADYILKTFK